MIYRTCRFMLDSSYAFSFQSNVMDRTIYFPALKGDVMRLLKRRGQFFRYYWFAVVMYITYRIARPFFNLFTYDLRLGALIFWGFLAVLLVALSFVVQRRRFRKLSSLESEGKALFLWLRKKGRNEHLGLFITFFLFALMAFSIPFLFLFWTVLACHYLFRYIYYQPSIVLIADDYELLIYKKHRLSVFDFSYANELRFIHNQVTFNHPLTGKQSYENININRDNVAELKAFLSHNFGKEMVINPATGLPYL